MKLRTLPCFLIVIIFFLACARQTSPTGGPKDSIPPKLVRSIPTNKQLNYKDKSVELNMSETVILNNPKEQILIIPSIGKDFKAIAKKKSIIITFDNPLQDSTTYTINFRESVQDITEKNPAKNLQLAFSTGPYIDSLELNGKAYDLLKGAEVKDITIALYQNADTFNIFKHKPIYLTKTNDKGFFKIENLKGGTYHIYAFEDKNKNLVVDSKNESYGYLAEPLILKETISNIQVPLVRLDARPLKLLSARPSNNYFNIHTSKNLVNYQITSDSLKLITCFGDDQSNIKVYNFINNADSLKINFKGYDSLQNSVDSTLYVKFSKRDIDPEKFSYRINRNRVEANTGDLTINIAFNKPIATIDFDSIFFQPDTTTTIKLSENDFTWDFTRNTLEIKKTLDKKLFVKDQPNKKAVTKKVEEPKKGEPTKAPKPNIKNQLTLGRTAFISIDNDSIKTTTENAKVLREEDTGMLITSVKTEEKNYILQILDKDYKPIAGITNTKTYKFQNLPPATYIIRLIIDKNGNGIWDAGNYFKHEEPEPIVFYINEKKEKTIGLKANWEVGPLLITYGNVVDNSKTQTK